MLQASLVQSEKAEDSRAGRRRSLRLSAHSRFPAGGERWVLVHNISVTGLLIEAPEGAMSIGESFVLDVAEASSVESKVVWNSGRFYGCEFCQPVSQAAVSAALLRSEPDSTDGSTMRPGAAPISGRGERLYPKVNFFPAFSLAVLAWVLIAFAAYIAFR